MGTETHRRMATWLCRLLALVAVTGALVFAAVGARPDLGYVGTFTGVAVAEAGSRASAALRADARVVRRAVVRQLRPPLADHAPSVDQSLARAGAALSRVVFVPVLTDLHLRLRVLRN